MKVGPLVPLEVGSPTYFVDLTISADKALETGISFSEDLDENDAHMTEWEQLIVNDVPKTYAPAISSKANTSSW